MVVTYILSMCPSGRVFVSMCSGKVIEVNGLYLEFARAEVASRFDDCIVIIGVGTHLIVLLCQDYMFIVLLEFVEFVSAAMLSFYTYYHILYVYCIVSLCHQLCLTFTFQHLPNYHHTLGTGRGITIEDINTNNPAFGISVGMKVSNGLVTFPGTATNQVYFHVQTIFSMDINLQLPLLLQLPLSLQLPSYHCYWEGEEYQGRL